MPNPFSAFPEAYNQTPAEKPPAGVISAFPEAYGQASPTVAPPNMAPQAFPPQEQGQPVFGLPQQVQTPFGSFNPTDIPIAGFFLNQKTYQAPTQEEVNREYQRNKVTVYNPLLPLGINAPISSDVPVIGGLAEAIGQAQSPTAPEMASAGFRDIPVIGEASRVGEAALNLLNQSWRTVAEPAAGLASLPIRGLVDQGAGDTLKRAEQRAGLTLAGGPSAWQEIGRAALAETPMAYKFVAPMVFDPLTYVGGWFSKAEGAKLTARSTMDVAEIAKLSPIERIIKTGFLKAPVSRKAMNKNPCSGCLFDVQSQAKHSGNGSI